MDSMPEYNRQNTIARSPPEGGDLENHEGEAGTRKIYSMYDVSARWSNYLRTERTT